MVRANAPGPALPEISVETATPDIAAIFAEIAHVAGIRLPALIWRHLATYPDVLPEAWAALAPLYRRGLVQERAWHGVRTVLARKKAGPSLAELRAMGLDVATIGAYRDVLSSYNRSNPVNLAGVRLLRLACQRRPGERGAPLPPEPVAWTPPAPVAEMVPMVPLAQISPPVRALIDGVAVAPGVDRSQVVPSLYRHLVPWPALVERIAEGLGPRIASGELAHLVSEVSRVLEGIGDELAPHVGHLPRLSRAEGVGTVLESFAGLIPEMVVVGHLLEAGLDA